MLCSGSTAPLSSCACSKAKSNILAPGRMPSSRLCVRSTYERSTPSARCVQPALRKKRRRAYWPGFSTLSVAGCTTMPLPESPVPIRWAWLSQTRAGSRPSHAARTRSCSASRLGRRARQGFHKPCSGQKCHAASEPAPAAARPPRRNFLRRPVLYVALQHLVLEILLFEDRLRHVAKRDDAEQLVVLHDRKVARAAFQHGAAQVVDFHFRRGRHRVAFHDVGDSDVAQRAAAPGEGSQQLMEGEHAHHAALLHDDKGAEILLGHGCDRIGGLAGRIDAQQAATLDSQDLLHLHGGPPSLARILFSAMAQKPQHAQTRTVLVTGGARGIGRATAAL